MIAVASLVAAFLIVGFVVVGAAFAGGRRGSGNEGPSRGASRLLYTGIAIVCVGIGLGLPLLLLIDNAADADRTAVGGVDLTAAQANGREQFATTCATCHTLQASNSVGAVGPNLDVLRPAAALTENAIQIGRANGRGNMPAALLTGEDAKDVADYVAAVAGLGKIETTAAPAPGSGGGAAPAQATAAPATPAAGGGSEQAVAEGKTVFSQSCAGCHTLAAADASGQVGPNLDQRKPDAAAVKTIVTDGRGGMPAFKGQLSDQQISAVAAFVAASAGS